MILQLIVSVALITVVVLQRSKGEGLGAIGGGAQLFFERAKGFDRFLDRATTVLAVAFMILSVVISIVI